nr:hypothetical protein GCM10017611_08420 [Rhodococcus wratislaviensis]
MHGSVSMPCPDCRKDPARIVAYEPIGLVAEPPEKKTAVSVAAAQPRRLSRKQLEERVAELEATLAALKRTE